MKFVVITLIFVGTLSFLWFRATSTSTPPSQKEEAANVFLQAGQEVLSPSPSPSTTPTLSPTLSPSATIIQLIPQTTVTALPSQTPTRTPTTTPTTTPTHTVMATHTPTATPQNTLSILSLSDPVAQKQDAKITVKTEPGATCTIEVTWPSGSISTSKDLSPKTSDQNGIVTWSWGVNWNTKPGTATIKLACIADGQTYSGQTTMQIIASQ